MLGHVRLERVVVVPAEVGDVRELFGRIGNISELAETSCTKSRAASVQRAKGVCRHLACERVRFGTAGDVPKVWSCISGCVSNVVEKCARVDTGGEDGPDDIGVAWSVVRGVAVQISGAGMD